MASVTSGGGSMRWISTRTTWVPQTSVASSSTWRNWVLMASREVSASSRSMSPMMFLRLVWASLVAARMKLATL